MKARKCLLWLAFSLRVSLSWLLLNRLCVAPFTGTASPTSWWKIAAVVFLRVAAHVGIFTVAVGASTTTCFTSWLIVDQYLLLCDVSGLIQIWFDGQRETEEIVHTTEMWWRVHISIASEFRPSQMSKALVHSLMACCLNAALSRLMLFLHKKIQIINILVLWLSDTNLTDKYNSSFDTEAVHANCFYRCTQDRKMQISPVVKSSF